ncbi:MAG: hypothetical protein UR25_C0003G0166 [Candidatus Nomurabacteria bacterium GW2011_GWE1_32_28]|uniref:Uncharacterized protein n=1 Tax=Candidatus Nomurabacteria bacterium GW2011_GWF1_31_48 TaxID=1618767 RepID=A0A0F9YG28_9BACT|nr:MAG: hypothetical protein UR10_C0003G0165 [Candidatus Nomurabacteria bacterium GW2011_GWF2_30_133]KKP28805.1 MAG: hypothetical protein UR18_C0002G0217 [Candidatus Nomurabacteria bacterium GW2011_GWE2_31_40]KKP30383.1 MAG: hypothetical protein UR19_C0003G0219 [Candidatus Nomurabacteria bacterium GW2011_GWF1_31_48]KKP34910.1 MAG: hypothetical protein UR25_C0003G0166 [Candidatus Nomurabacteria bacterium GW2011_GWE1_32_28]HAS81001.1 hypothetical protein [Candidatus Nomurabacteria bacterium]
MQKYFKYLPSKKFILITVGIVILGIIVFIVFFMSSSGENFLTENKKSSAKLKVENQTISELIQNDTDGDGIADWEEALWGTDKNTKITFGDMTDATYIENKKKELNIEQKTSINETKLTETEKFARQFFTSYNAMRSSGEVDKDTIDSFSNALGQKIIDPNLIDRYSEIDIKINEKDDTTSREEYYINIKKIFKKYQTEGIGRELSIVSNGLASSKTSNDGDKYNELSTIAISYQNFAKEVIKTNVPKSLKYYHLQIANSSNNTGISVSNMEKIADDTIIGLSGLSQYQKYSEDLIKAVIDLEKYLLKQ